MFGKILGSATKFIFEVPKIVSLVESVASLIKGGMTGDAKHALAVQLVREAVLEAEGISGHEIADEARMSAGVDKIISGVVDVLSSVKQ